MARGIVFPTLNIGNSVVFSLVDDPDVARSIIDRDIARLEEKIRALNSRRNEFSPISRLPPESPMTLHHLLLLHFFSFREIKVSIEDQDEACTGHSAPVHKLLQKLKS